MLYNNTHQFGTCEIPGLCALSTAHRSACNASCTQAVDVNNDKKKAGEFFGATEFVNPNDYDKPIQEVLCYSVFLIMEEVPCAQQDWCFTATHVPTNCSALCVNVAFVLHVRTGAGGPDGRGCRL